MIVTLDHALAGSLAPAVDTETGKPMKWDIKPGALIFGKNTDREQVQALGDEEAALWKSSSV